MSAFGRARSRAGGYETGRKNPLPQVREDVGALDAVSFLRGSGPTGSVGLLYLLFGFLLDDRGRCSQSGVSNCVRRHADGQSLSRIVSRYGTFVFFALLKRRAVIGAKKLIADWPDYEP